MLVQLYRDNYTTTPTEFLITSIYSGFFDGYEGWFNTATLLNTDLRTSNLTNLNTITLNLFNSLTTQSVKVTGFFRAKKTGTYRFYTYSNDKNILEIDGDDIIVNNNLKQISFANKSLIAGQYYSFNLFYGSRVFQYPPALLSSSLDTTALSGQLYGNGPYNVTYSTQQQFNEARRIFSNTGKWRPLTSDNIGAWIQLELPSAIVLDSYLVTTQTGGLSGVPTSFKLEGSNDNFVTRVSLSQVSWDINQGSKTIKIDPPVNEAFKYFRLTNLANGHNTTFIQFNYPLIFYEKAVLECGYMEPNDDGTSSGSTNPADFITNATGLTTYYDINPETQNVVTTGANPLTLYDNTLQGLFKVSPLAVYFNRQSFATGKGALFYVQSDDLFNNFNGTYKNYIQLHEHPIAGDTETKRFTQFSDDMSFECQLDGKIEVSFRRAVNDNVSFRYAMLILDVEKISEHKI